MGKKVFIFDTETTWLLASKKSPIEDQPYIVQFAWIVIEVWDDNSFKEINRINQLIRPPEKISWDSSQIHWIYDIDVQKIWTIDKYANIISYYINNVDCIVAHNLSFDESVIRYEFERLRILWLPFDFNPKSKICTMNNSRDWCGIPSENVFATRPKPPSLQELCKILFWKYFEWWHDAITDVEWTTKAFVELLRRQVFSIPETEAKLALF